MKIAELKHFQIQLCITKLPEHQLKCKTQVINSTSACRLQHGKLGSSALVLGGATAPAHWGQGEGQGQLRGLGASQSCQSTQHRAPSCSANSSQSRTGTLLESGEPSGPRGKSCPETWWPRRIESSKFSSSSHSESQASHPCKQHLFNSQE